MEGYFKRMSLMVKNYDSYSLEQLKEEFSLYNAIAMQDINLKGVISVHTIDHLVSLQYRILEVENNDK